MSKKIIKLAVVVPAVIGSLVLVSILIFNAVRHKIIEDHEVLVHAVAQNILPALLVNNTSQVEVMLHALESYPGIESAELISAEGASIASYARAGHALDPISPAFELASATDDPNQVHVMAPITFDSLIVANLHIAVNLWPTYLRIMMWLGVLLIVPSVIYVLIKQSRIKLRFERVAGGGSGPGGKSFSVAEAVNAEMGEAEISLEYQPIQRMSDSGLFGMEVVVCWRHPSGQTIHVSPSDFVGVAENANICLPFDDWLLTTACKQAAAWQHQYGPLILTINISAIQFENADFAKKIRSICEQTQYPYQLLELEVNESVVSSDLQQAIARVQAFAEQGLSITVDDFGLTQTSLDLLEVLPINKVKLDYKLVKRMSYDEKIHELIQTIIVQALSQDVQVMADGLDTPEQHAELQSMGCIFGQGAYFYAPFTVSGFDNFLATRPFDVTTKRASRIGTKLTSANEFSAA